MWIGVAELQESVPPASPPRASPRLGRVVRSAEMWIGDLFGIVAAALLIADALLVFVSVGRRVLTGSSITWVYEVSTVLLVVIAFVGAVAAYARNEHIGMMALVERWPQSWRAPCHAVANGAILLFVGIALVNTIDLVANGTGTLPATGWSLRVLYGPLALGLAFIAVIAVLRLTTTRWTDLLFGMAALAAVLAAGWFAADAFVALADAAPWALIVIVVLLGFATGIPIAFILGIAALILLLLHPGLDLSTVPLQMLGGVNSFVLLALPFFVFTGGLLSIGGISDRLMRFVDDVTCRVPGGSAMSGVLAMYLFSGLSGAKIADVAAVAPVLMPSMRARGHTQEEVVGVLSASAAMGEAVPPSLAILILTAITSVSTGALFLGGLLPAASVAIVIILVIALRARRSAITTAVPPDLRTFGRHFLSAIVPGGMLAIIFGGIIGGVATPIEASSLAVIYGLVVTTALYRTPPRNIARLAVTSARLSGMLLFLLATTAVLVWILTVDGIAGELQQVALLFAHEVWAFMLVTIAVLVLTGLVFEGLPAIVIFAPLLLPVAVRLGINPLQYSIVLVMAMGVGAFLPPLGIGYFATCSLASVRPERAIRTTLIYMAAALVGIGIIAAIPEITLFLPRLVHAPGV